MELDRSRGSVRVSALVLYDFGEQDAIIKAQRRHGKWQFSSTGAAFAPQLQACAFTICKKGKPSFPQPKIHRQNLTIILAAPTECVSICFAIFPGGVSEPKGNLSTLIA